MNLTWHIIKKDALRMRWALLLWVLLLVGEVALNWLLLSPSVIDPEGVERLKVTMQFSTLIGTVVTYLMVAAWVLEEPLVGTDMFWVTRPISGGRLLGAKVLGILLVFGGMSLAVRLPWVWYCGFDVAQIGRFALTNTLSLSAYSLVAMAVASLTGKSSRFLLGTLLMLLTGFVILSLQIYQRGDRLNEAVLSGRFLLASLLATGGCIAVVVWMYLKRRLPAACVMMGGAVWLIVLIMTCAPWTQNELWPEKLEPVAGSDAITLEIVGTNIEAAKANSANQYMAKQLTLWVRCGKLPEGLQFDSGTADVELSWPDGTVLRRAATTFVARSDDQPVRYALAMPAKSSDVETAKRLAEERQNQPRPSTQVKSPLALAIKRDAGESLGAVMVGITPPEADRIAKEPPVCTAHVRLPVKRMVALMEMPLRSGETKAAHGVRTKVITADEELGALNNRTQKPARIVKLTVSSASATNIAPIYYCLDRVRNEVGTTGQISRFINITSFTFNQAQLTAPVYWRDGRWVQDDDWASQQTLAVLQKRMVGTIQRTLRSEKLEILITTLSR
ncbi:MAG: hypothetical protein HZA31_05175 [Opitutae bacterium]|nr:hypothetical protein [Opitutae bacterium]